MAWDGRERRGDNLNERVAVLESELEGVQMSNAAILKKLERIEGELTRYKGFLGGIAFLGSALVTAAALLWDKVVGK